MICQRKDDQVEQAVLQAEKALEECFQMLLQLKHGDDDISNVIMNFQPTLAQCLYDLMLLYNDLQHNRDALIHEKSKYEPDEFRVIMSKNARYTRIVKNAIGIGKNLGDAFAWPFYEHNREELLKHYEHQSTGLFVSGSGGIGEIEFIKRNRALDGLFVIYHGITSILRIGDFSLYAPGQGIVGVGEIKTKQDGNALNINCFISSKVNLETAALTADEGCIFSHVLTGSEVPSDFERLEEQLRIQHRLLFEHDDSKQTMQEAKYEHELLGQFSPSKRVLFNRNQSLLLYFQPYYERDIFQIWGEDKIKAQTPNDWGRLIETLMVPESEDNRLIIGSINTDMTYLRTPIFWWKINDDICEKIYWGKIQIATIFNPAVLIQHIKNKGFELISLKDSPEITMVKVDGNKRFEFHNVELLFDLVAHSLMRTEYLIEILDAFMSDAESQKYNPNTKIELIIQQLISPPPKDL